MTERAARIVIEGRVQGVFFRAWIAQEADARGLSGWVRNRRDGAVEALFWGPGADVDGMIAACRQGPPMAQVTDITPYPAEAPERGGFQHLPTV